MSQTNWQQANNHYLTCTLAWLRLRLVRLIQNQTSLYNAFGLDQNLLASSNQNTIHLAGGNNGVQTEAATTVLEKINEEQVQKAAARMEEVATACDPPPALLLLSQRLGLSRFEQEVLLLCVAMELDTRVAALCAEAQTDPTKNYPTFALALALFDEPSWDILSPERPLRYWRLIEISQPTGRPLTNSALRADERIVSYLKGLNYLDDRLTTIVTPIRTEVVSSLPPSQQNVVEVIIRYWQSAATANLPLPIVQLSGPHSMSKQLVARYATAQLGLHLYRLPAELLPQAVSELETFTRLWQRESVLLPLALYLDVQERENSSSEGQGLPASITRFLNHCDGFCLIGVRDVWPQLGSAVPVLNVMKPTRAEQQALWHDLVGQQAPDLAGKLATQFNLDLLTIEQLAQNVQIDTSDPEAQLWEACRQVCRPRLDNLVQRLEPKVSWQDLVLPEIETNLLHQIAEQVGQRHKVYNEWGFGARLSQGLGTNVLFAGVSGTGKTMAAEVLAAHLGLNLYRIDLSAVVSKYIGETEKNLRSLFDAAEDGGAILFFDEADALFGKRSEIKDSHDRYANIEVNYLLQRMEAYSGLAILATNMKSALDPAFMRRLRFVVNFPFPGLTERRVMWQKVFPSDTPVADLDYERLARLNLTGGNIHSVALNAAFIAASQNTTIKMPMLMMAARTEFQKLERPINEADFRL